MDRRRFLEASVLGSLATAFRPLDIHAAVCGMQERFGTTQAEPIKQIFNLSEHYDPAMAKDLYLEPKKGGASFAHPPPAPEQRVLYYDVDKKTFLPPPLLEDSSSLLNKSGTYTMDAYLRRYKTEGATING